MKINSRNKSYKIQVKITEHRSHDCYKISLKLIYSRNNYIKTHILEKKNSTKNKESAKFHDYF